MKNLVRLFVLIFYLFLVFPKSNAQDLIWALQYKEQPASVYGTYHEQKMNGFKYISDGGILTFGRFEDDVDFDPGPGIAISNAGTIGNGYIVKLDSLGNFLWSHVIYGNYGSVINDIDVDEDGNIYAIGSSRGVTDYDYPNGETVGSGADWEVFIMKLDSSGNFISALNYGHYLNDDYGYEISICQGKIYFAGIFEGNVNLDPNFTDTLLVSSYMNNFVMSIDTNYSYNWIKYSPCNGYSGIALEHDESGNIYYCYNGGSRARLKKFDEIGNQLMLVDWGPDSKLFIEAMDFDANGGIYLTGRGYSDSFSVSSYDMDPGPNQYLFGGGIFILRLDSNGDFYFGKAIGGTMWNQYVISSAYGISVDYQKNIYISGSFKSTVDFDPAPETSMNLSAGAYSTDAFVARYDSLGNFVWVYEIQSSEEDISTSVFVDEKMNVTNSGAFNCIVDFDPSSSTYNLSAYGCSSNMEDSYIQKVSQDSCDHLGIIIDTISGLNCSSSGYASCYGTNSIEPYSYSWAGMPFNSNSEFYPDTSGNYTVIVMSSNGCVAQRTVNICGPIDEMDVQVNCVPGAFIPGVNSSLYIDAFNQGCNNVSGEIVFVIPELMDFTSSSIFPDYMNGDTLKWYYTDLNYQSPHFVTQIFYSTDTTANIGDSLCFPLSITPLIDNNEENNLRYYCFPVVNSYDPNNKFVYPSGVCVPNYIDTSDVLTYTVNFQNTGTSPAINIYILDEIDSDLNLSTLEIKGSSFPVQTEILPNNLVKFRFDNINLSDSSSNESLSKGYLIFEIKQNEDLANNTDISNSVGIYFDFNAPVLTNTVTNTVVDVVPGINILTASLDVCDSVIIDNQLYTSSGQILLDYSNQFGCDSLVYLDINLKNSSFANMTASVCDSFLVADQYVSSAGYHQFHLINSFGCDSTILLDLIILNSVDTVSISTCSPIDLNGIQYDTSGFYSQVLTNQMGCDSLVFIDLNINSNLDSTINLTNCDSVSVNDVTYYTDGIYSQTLTSFFGCDSMLLVNVDVLASDHQNFIMSSCYEFNFNDSTYLQSGNYNHYFTNSDGCDSIVNLVLTIYNNSESELNIEGMDSISVNDETYYTSGVYEQTITNVYGCDSLLTIYAEINYSGIIDLDETKINLHPNPTDGVFTLQFEGELIDFSCYDLLGRSVKIIYDPEKSLFYASSLENGEYQLHIKTEFTVYRKNFIISR